MLILQYWIPVMLDYLDLRRYLLEDHVLSLVMMCREM